MKRSPGHPAKQDPEVAKLFRTMKASVELVGALEGRVSEGAYDFLRCAVLAQMEVYSEMTGKPSAIGLILNDKEVVF